MVGSMSSGRETKWWSSDEELTPWGTNVRQKGIWMVQIFWNFKAHMPVTYVLQQSHNSFPKSPTNWVHCSNVWIYGAIIIHTTIDRNPTSYLDIFVLFTADWNKNWQWPQSLVFRSRCFEFDMLFSKRSVKHWHF